MTNPTDSQLRTAGASEAFIHGTDSTKARLLAAMTRVGYIQKDKENDHFRYKYLSEEAVKRAVQSALVDAGEMPDSITFPSDRMQFWQFERKNRPYTMAMVVCVIKFTDGHVFEGLGCGEDDADKFVMKAQTSAIREAWKNIFSIPSGKDPEEHHSDTARAAVADAPKKQADKPNKSQLEGLAAARKAHGLNQTMVLTIIRHAFGVERFNDLDAKQIGQLEEILVGLTADAAENVRNGSMDGVPKAGA